MTAAPPLPAALRRAVADDLRPVRPLAAPARRALVFVLWAALLAFLVLAVRGPRPDAAQLGLFLGWGVVLAELGAGATLAALALAETVPGRGAARRDALLALAGSGALFVVFAVLVRRASTGMPVADPLLSFGPTCFGLQGLVGLTALTLVALLILRAAPLRAAFAGLLGGAGSGLMADGVYHLHCPITHLAHVLAWHASAILLLALVGFAFGLAVERRERRLMDRLLDRPKPQDPA